MAKELSQEEVNRLAGDVVDKAMEAARECKEKYPYDPKAFFRCCLPAFRQEMTHRGTDPEAIKVAERFGLVFDGMMEDLYEFTVAKGPEEAKGITFVVSDLSQVESRLAEKLKEFGIEEGNPGGKKHWTCPKCGRLNEYYPYQTLCSRCGALHYPEGEPRAKYYYCDNAHLHANSEVLQIKTLQDNPPCPYCGAIMTYGRYWGPLPATQKEYVTIINPGKTTFKVGEVVSHEAFAKENERTIRLGEKPAAGR
jgi:rubrerythrin